MSDVRFTGAEKRYLEEALEGGHWYGGGPFARRCEASIRADLDAGYATIVPSGTAALEMCALLADLKPGDEVVMPSFTFSSTANAVVLRGATPVFVDVRADTLNIDEARIEAALTPKTRAIFAVHYAGVCCEMDAIGALANERGLIVMEDAAQAYLSRYRGRPAGCLGTMAAFSFHQTKNFTCGEGGAFVTGSAAIFGRAEKLQEKGTDRSNFQRGIVDKYTWVDVGSSYLPSEFQAAVLLAQLERARAITQRRLELWNRYHDGLAQLESRGILERPVVPAECEHNAQVYRVMLRDEPTRDALMAELRAQGIAAAFHFLPLHLSPAGKTYGRAAGDLAVTCSASARLLRLPLGQGTTEEDVDRTIERVYGFLLK